MSPPKGAHTPGVHEARVAMAATPSAKHQLDPMERDPPDAVRKSMDSMCPALRSVRAGAARRRLGQIEVDHHKRSGAAPPPLPLERKADPPKQNAAIIHWPCHCGMRIGRHAGMLV